MKFFPKFREVLMAGCTYVLRGWFRQRVYYPGSDLEFGTSMVLSADTFL